MGLNREQYNCFKTHNLPISSQTKRALKRAMARWLRREGKQNPETESDRRIFHGKVW